MLRNRKYVLDLTNLQYKQVRLPWKKKLLRFVLSFTASILIALLYGLVFERTFGSPKEKMLVQEVENMKLQYSLIGRRIENSVDYLNSLKLSDDIRYRPVLDLDSIPESIRKGGYGGTDRFRDLTGYMNSNLLISYRSKIEEIKNMANVQTESFQSVAETSADWRRENDHFPGICPVNVSWKRGDGYKFRDVHPVLGSSRMHYGQDFRVPYGTEIFATGDGTVISSGYNTGGFGNYVKIDHGYGLQTIYGHLSEIRVVKGQNIKRCDMIGRSGDSGTSTGPHLHYEIIEFGQHKNPLNYFSDDISEDEFNEMIQAFGSKSMFK